MTRGRILRDANAGPGLLTVEGKQYSFTLEQMWVSDVPPKAGMTVDVIFDTRGTIERVGAVPESQLAKEGASAALADSKRHSGALADGIVRRFGVGTPVALAILSISWVFLPALIIQLPYSAENVSFWGLLGYVAAPNTAAVLGQDPRILSAGIWGVLAVLVLAAPLLGIVWKDTRAALGGGSPLLFMILVFTVLRASISHLAQSARGNQGLEGMANSIVDEAVNQVWRSSAFGAGFYISAICALYLAATGIRQYFGTRTA